MNEIHGDFDDKHCAAPPKMSGDKAVTCSSLQHLMEQPKKHRYLQLGGEECNSAKYIFLSWNFLMIL